MQTLKAFLDQSLNIWKESTAAARFGIILLLLICAGTIVGVGIWSAQPHYVTLATHLSHSKSTQLMAALDQANIHYQIKGAGSIILVDKQDFNQASVLAGSRGIGMDDVEVETASPWMDPINQQNVFRRNLEKQLAHSIQRYANIETATVHLSIPERQPFLRQSPQPSAAVVIDIASGHRFTEAHAAAIAQLIANAVPGMRADQVAISDTAGNLYSNDENMGRLTKQEEYRINRERDLTQKAQAMLTNFLGIGNARVEITADFSFPEGRTTIKEFDPNKRVATSEIIDSSTSSGQSLNSLGQPTGSSSGIAGTGSNSGTTRPGDSNRSQVTKSETVNSTYEVSSTVREDIVRTPVMNLMTISVLVNSNKVQNESKEIPGSVKTSIEGLVKQAVGFRDGVDQFNLEFFEFVDLLPTTDVSPGWLPWDQIQSLLRNISLGVAALVALLIGRKTLQSLQPAPSTGPVILPGEQGERMAQLSELVKQNPQVFSKILSSWANETVPEKTEQNRRRAA
jgi:flagellar M-ring protein FliF